MKIKLVCEFCKKEFDRERKEHTRNTKKGRRVYCSLTCSALNNPVLQAIAANPNLNYLRKGSVTDEFSPFRQHINNIRRHALKKKIPVDITLDDLRQLWIKQKGVCPYSGWELVNFDKVGHKLSYSPNRATVDRIDSSKGYTIDNVQFVSFMAQFAKNNFAEHELFKFCSDVVNYRNLK